MAGDIVGVQHLQVRVQHGELPRVAGHHQHPHPRVEVAGRQLQEAVPGALRGLQQLVQGGCGGAGGGPGLQEAAQELALRAVVVEPRCGGGGGVRHLSRGGE